MEIKSKAACDKAVEKTYLVADSAMTIRIPTQNKVMIGKVKKMRRVATNSMSHREKKGEEYEEFKVLKKSQQ